MGYLSRQTTGRRRVRLYVYIGQADIGNQAPSCGVVDFSEHPDVRKAAAGEVSRDTGNIVSKTFKHEPELRATGSVPKNICGCRGKVRTERVIA